MQNHQELNILFVDDDATSRMIGCYLLEDESGQVITAVNGQDALEKLQRHPIDLVLTDINMPVMDGLELKHALEQSHPDIPVVTMSANDSEKHRNKYKSLGFYAMLAKPLIKEDLVCVVNSARALLA